MRKTLWRRIIMAGFRGFYRNRTVSLSSIFILTITLSIVASFYLSRAVFDYTLTQIREKVDVRVYFTVDATDDQITTIQAKLRGLTQVKSVTYTSKEVALEEFKKKHEGDQLTLQALDELGANPFGASLAIVAKDTSQYDAIAKQLSSGSGLLGDSVGAVDKINYYQLKDSIDKLNNIIGWTNTVGFWISILFILMSCMIVYNTIRLAIFVYRDEIAVMKLVGASNMFIRGPFIVEAVLYSLVATSITLALFFPATMWFTKKTVFFFEGMNLHTYYTTHFFELTGLLLLSAVTLAVVSSLLAVRKYLKV
ncbi:MAG: ABC transporter permease [Candidatus Pacebacteria bacterium]|nr:ABC transporter permease [Candidatus Paceibacterota bacterium]MBP9866551.1 ABC transporter permease [Candidatus Paceibacterota bacterium]